MPLYSSTESAVDVEGHFEHSLRKKKCSKKRTNLALNQSRKKRKIINYGQQIRIKKVADEIETVDENSLNIQVSVLSEEPAVKLLASTGDNILSSDSDREEVDVVSDGSVQSDEINPFLRECITKCKNVFMEDVMKKFDDEGLLSHLMAFMEMISTGQLLVLNMAVLLAIEISLLHTLKSAIQMRYRSDTCLFWDTVLAVGGPRTLCLFSSDKHFRQANSGESVKSKYQPSKGSFNFAVPDEKTLGRSRTGLPKIIECGLIQKSVKLVDKEKEFVLSLDGKQLIPGLINETEGDVNLWGYEGPPSLKDNLECLEPHKDAILDVMSKASIDDNGIDVYSADLKLIVQIITKHIHDLREVKVRHELLRSRFQKKISCRPEIGSRYDVAFSDIDCFIRHADIAIENLLKINIEWCYIMLLINSNSHCFRR